MKMLPHVISEPWVGETGFVIASELAGAILESDPKSAEILMLAAVRQQPNIALRSYRDYAEQFPFAEKLLTEAITLEPAEAGGIAMSATRTGQTLRDRLTLSSVPWAPALLKIADRPDLDRPTKIRVASLAPVLDKLTEEGAIRAARSTPDYFRALLTHRKHAAVRRALENFSQRTMVELRQSGARGSELAQYSASELYSLIVYGRGELNKDSFQAVFDVLLPKLRASRLLP
ncbi:MAG: hypothetical protein JNL98_42710, partial [Bryobacterales bacterium]|nr:hypothetical protein [Bryobacterales bacterium]